MTEDQLEDKGYRFSGAYSEDKGKMKKVAASYRAKGFFATVTCRTYKGRVYNTIGYSVYIKERIKP